VVGLLARSRPRSGGGSGNETLAGGRRVARRWPPHRATDASDPHQSRRRSLDARHGRDETFGGADESFGRSSSGATLGPAPIEATTTRPASTWTATVAGCAPAYERADGGVDIHADINRDGVVDFVGHDYERDGLVMRPSSTRSRRRLDTRMFDDNGDGWMDRARAFPSGATRRPSGSPA